MERFSGKGLHDPQQVCWTPPTVLFAYGVTYAKLLFKTVIGRISTSIVVSCCPIKATLVNVIWCEELIL